MSPAMLPRFRFTVFWAILGAFVPSPALAQQADKQSPEVTLDRLVALVEGQENTRETASILLLSDLVLAARVDGIRVFGVDGKDLQITEAMLERTLKEELVSLLVYREAVRYDIVAVAPSDVLSQRDELAQRIGGPEALDTWLKTVGASVEALDTLLHRRMVVDTFLGYKKSEVPPPSEDELRVLYASGSHPFGGKSYDQARDDLLLLEQTRRATAALKDWMNELRANARIRLY